MMVNDMWNVILAISFLAEDWNVTGPAKVDHVKHPAAE
ncbi:hypothetical protein LP7551_02769 [Roseibium album]|nr:hypothetical protein LP7551_02769 [Roseibium album]